MRRTSWEAVDEWWGALVGVPGPAVWHAGTRVSRRPAGERSLVVVGRGEAVHVALPGWVDASLERQLRKGAPADLLDRSFWKRVAKPLDRSAGHLVVHSYTEDPVDGAAGTEEIDPREVRGWVDVVKPERWTLSGFGDHVVTALGVRAPGGDLAAAASLTRDGEPFTTIGVLTHPAHRGRGFAARVARAAASRSVADHGPTCYRARADDPRGRSIGRALGFTDRCQRLDVG